LVSTIDGTVYSIIFARPFRVSIVTIAQC
jgi:hypothetical protein